MALKEEFFLALNERHGVENQKRFLKAKVAICGLGGLGSNIAVCLARAGIGKLILIDFDQVDLTNIHRQQYKLCQIGKPKAWALKENLTEINPFMEIETHVIKINEKNAELILKEADIVCEAFDKASEKAMLINFLLEKMPEKYVLSGSGMAGFKSANDVVSKKISKNFYVFGDGKSDVNDCAGLVSSRVTVCAAHEAHMVLRILLGKYDV